MFPPASKFCRLALTGIALIAAGRANAQLAAKSPFMPTQGPAANTPTAGAPLEYRGYIEMGGGVQYRIYDPAKKVGTWVKLNEKNSDFDVLAKQYDTGKETLVIEHQGRTLTLEERKPKIVSSGNGAQAMPPPPAPPPAPNVAPAVIQSVVLNPTAAEEQRRLEAVAAEVARRRALREQATNQISQGVQPQVAVPQPIQPQAQQQRNYQQPQQAQQPGQMNARPPNNNNGRGPGQQR